MINWLLRIGLVVTPFILAPGRPDIARGPKMTWAVVFALTIGLTALYQGTLKPFKNKFALAFVGFALLSFYLSPNPALRFFGVLSGRFWSWEPLFYFLTFLLMTVAISSVKHTQKDIDLTFDIMIWCGAAMATLVVFQYFCLDQFFEHRFGVYGRMAGTLGNPTLVGPYLCMLVPLAFFRKKFFFAVLMIVALVMTHSDVARIGFVAMGVCYLALRNKKAFIVTSVVSLWLLGSVVCMYMNSQTFRESCPDNERFLTCSQALNDLRIPIMQNSKKIYAITGIGPGSFKYLFHAKNNMRNENFLYAHNEYVQVAYEYGIVGFLLFMGMLGLGIWHFVPFRKVFAGEIEPRRRALLSGLAGIAVCAGGIFIWQIGTHIFYTLTIVGFLYNDSVWKEGDSPCQPI